MAISGLLLVLFLASHLSANLLLIKSSSEPFNRYVAWLAGFGWLLTIAELGLLFVFILHIVTAIQIKIGNKKARAIPYKIVQSKGSAISTVSSRTMAITGLGLLIFLIFHIIQFRFGAGISQGYSTQLDGKLARDLYRLVFESFHNPLVVIFYSFCMILLGFHLRHAFWSAFHSLGLSHSNISNIIYKMALVVALVYSIGFLIIPIWIYFDLGIQLGGGLK